MLIFWTRYDLGHFILPPPEVWTFMAYRGVFDFKLSKKKKKKNTFQETFHYAFSPIFENICF